MCCALGTPLTWSTRAVLWHQPVRVEAWLLHETFLMFMFVLGMTLTQTSGAVTWHQPAPVEPAWVLQFWEIFCMLWVDRMGCPVSTMSKGLYSLLLLLDQQLSQCQLIKLALLGLKVFVQSFKTASSRFLEWSWQKAPLYIAHCNGTQGFAIPVCDNLWWAVLLICGRRASSTFRVIPRLALDWVFTPSQVEKLSLQSYLAGIDKMGSCMMTESSFWEQR